MNYSFCQCSSSSSRLTIWRMQRNSLPPPTISNIQPKGAIFVMFQSYISHLSFREIWKVQSVYLWQKGCWSTQCHKEVKMVIEHHCCHWQAEGPIWMWLFITLPHKSNQIIWSIFGQIPTSRKKSAKPQLSDARKADLLGCEACYEWFWLTVCWQDGKWGLRY